MIAKCPKEVKIDFFITILRFSLDLSELTKENNCFRVLAYVSNITIRNTVHKLTSLYSFSFLMF